MASVVTYVRCIDTWSARSYKVHTRSTCMRACVGLLYGSVGPHIMCVAYPVPHSVLYVALVHHTVKNIGLVVKFYPVQNNTCISCEILNWVVCRVNCSAVYIAICSTSICDTEGKSPELQSLTVYTGAHYV